MQLEYKWLICLFKHSNILRIFNEIKNKIAPSVCVCYFCLHHQKLFIHITQKIQTNKYNHEKRSKYLEVGKVAKPVLLYSNRLEGYLESDGDETGSRRISCLRRLTGRKAGCSKQYIFFNCIQTLWESREEVLRLPYGKLSSPVTRIMNTFMVLNMCQTLDFITYHIQMILSINLSHICQYTHTRAHAHP